MTAPILFGDFMRMGADKADRVYEELTNMDKLQTVLTDVRTMCSSLSLVFEARFWECDFFSVNLKGLLIKGC